MEVKLTQRKQVFQVKNCFALRAQKGAGGLTQTENSILLRPDGRSTREDPTVLIMVQELYWAGMRARQGERGKEPDTTQTRRPPRPAIVASLAPLDRRHADDPRGAQTQRAMQTPRAGR